jgi:hypothetical protein
MTTTYTFEQLKEDVRKEAEALRVHATKEEIDRLDFKQLDPEAINGCIYGSMTFSCDSARAIELITKCACRYVADNSLNYIASEGFDRIAKHANGSTVSDLAGQRHGSDLAHYSAIEAYILLPEARNENLIAYLKGETDNLEL